jgi:hypothetical protein
MDAPRKTPVTARVPPRQGCHGQPTVRAHDVALRAGSASISAVARVLDSQLVIRVLAVLGATTMSSCLVVSDPQFDAPIRRAPVFLPDRATPDSRRVIKIDQTTPSVDFVAPFVSEDVGTDVETRLFIDYGVPTGDNKFVSLILGNVIPAGTLEDGERIAKATWRSDQATLSPGCHRMTLVVAHDFGENGCPITQPNDPLGYDAISWTVVRCDDDCASFDLTTQCPAFTDSCAPEPSN